MDMRKVRFEDVLQHLGRYADLKEFGNVGCIGGQAVASAIQDLYMEGRGGVYNDIDLFVTEDSADQTRLNAHLDSMNSRQQRIQMVTHSEVDVSSGYGELDLHARYRYAVLFAYDRGMVNEVVTSSVRKHRWLDWDAARHRQYCLDIIQSFDFNCVQVGLDLWNRTVVWTPEFARFLATRQIEVVSTHTPAHTAIRLLRKLDALQEVYADVPRLMTTLAGAQLAQLVREIRRTPERDVLQHTEGLALYHELRDIIWVDRGLHCQRLFGAKHHARAKEVEAQLAPWFSLERAGKSQCLFTLMPKVHPDEAFMREAVTRPTAHYPTLVEAFIRPHKPSVRAKLQALVGVAPGRKNGKLMPYWPLPRDADGRIVNASELANDAWDIRSFLSASATVMRHPGLAPMVRQTNSMSEQLALVAVAQKEAKRRGEWVYGVLENVPYGESGSAYSVDELNTLIEKQSKVLMRSLSKPLGLPTLAHAVRAKELVTGADLMSEGSLMRHCVGGYGDAVESGFSVIVSLRGDMSDKDSWSTVEFSGPSRWRDGPLAQTVCIRQHFGRFNSKPADANRKAAQILLDSLLRYAVQKRYPVLSRVLGVSLSLKLDIKAKELSEKWHKSPQYQWLNSKLTRAKNQQMNDDIEWPKDRLDDELIPF